jgi:hypothetical protein
MLYIDPGNGTLLLQILIAGITGAIFYFGKIWTRIKRFFIRDNSLKNGQ